jgi:hypothetical protein
VQLSLEAVAKLGDSICLSSWIAVPGPVPPWLGPPRPFRWATTGVGSWRIGRKAERREAHARGVSSRAITT